MHKIVIPTLEELSGKKAGVDFGVCNNPEFLREGSAVKDFHHPPKTVIGELDQASGDILVTLYNKLDAPLIRTDLESAEMVKYVDNSWHALKIGFANEIGNLCKSRPRCAQSHEHLLSRSKAQYLSRLPIAGFCVRRLVLAQRSSGAFLSGQNA